MSHLKGIYEKIFFTLADTNLLIDMATIEIEGRVIEGDGDGFLLDPASGKERTAVAYSFTGAMSPLKKESAFLHLPTYSAGLIYHRGLSSPDDYISNILVTIFQFTTALVILIPSCEPVYYFFTGLLLPYFPLGKLKHAVYFFAARYHLGVFFGHRNVWPPKPL